MQGIGKVKNEMIENSIIKIEDNLFKNLPIDFLVKISVLTTIAGYLKTNDIYVNDRGLRDDSSLEDFLSFLLNDRDFAPMRYKIRLLGSALSEEEKGREDRFGDGKTLGDGNGLDQGGGLSHNYNSVILFSGGIDSSSALLFALDQGWKPLLLWVGFGQRNEETEEKAVKKIAERFNKNLLVIKLGLKNYIEEGWKSWDYIVPGRNFMFAVLGAALLAHSEHHENRILMGVTEEEINNPNPGSDKSSHFFQYCSELFSKFYKKDIKLITPFDSISKTELVAYWNNVWQDKYGIDLHETTSCYYGSNCGTCNACFKRSVAFMAAGIGLDGDIKQNPFQADETMTNNYIKRCFGDFGEKKKFSKKRAIETLLAYKKAIDHLPEEVRKIIFSLPIDLQKKVAKKENELSAFLWKPNQ